MLNGWLEEWIGGGAAGLWRAAGALVTAFVAVLALGPWWIARLEARRVLDRAAKGDSERLDRLSAHKDSTPTLGGVLLVGATIAATLLWADLGERLVWLLVVFVLALLGLGLADDLAKLRSRSKGILARHKLAWQLLISLGASLYLWLDPPTVTLAGGETAAPGGLWIPLVDAYLDLGPLAIVWVAFVATGTSNAVNLTDGLDGLAAGCSLLVLCALGAAIWLGGDSAVAAVLAGPRVAGVAEVGVLLAALAGACIGFLWFNCHPARIFMGDTGSLPLGGALGLGAVLAKQEVVLLVAGGVLVAEALSVILQVGSYKLWRRRVFRCAPLHHHFQFAGLSETKITVRFWIVGAFLALASVASLSRGAGL